MPLSVTVNVGLVVYYWVEWTSTVHGRRWGAWAINKGMLVALPVPVQWQQCLIYLWGTGLGRCLRCAAHVCSMGLSDIWNLMQA